MAEVYLITNTVNNKKYVGLTRNGYKNRFSSHLQAAFVSNKKGVLYDAMRKYGLTKFGIEVVFQNPSSAVCGMMEQVLVKKWNTQVPNGYNMTPGGESIKGYKTLKDEDIPKCLYCGNLFVMNGLSEGFCSDICRKEYVDKMKAGAINKRLCVTCNFSFIVPVDEPAKLFCSEFCEEDFSLENCKSDHLELATKKMLSNPNVVRY